MSHIGIIPVRFGSRRFPGKPLADILGKPMFWHVYRRAAQCADLDQVVVATDDDRIFNAAVDEDIPVVMTRSDHPSGTDRVLEAVDQLGISAESVVVNIQGDEPLLNPLMLTELMQPFESPATRVTTLAQRIDAQKARNQDVVKVVCARNGQALYFSRSMVPFDRQDGKAVYWGHIGLYAYRKDVLEQFVELGSGRLERIERLEQLRLLENGIPIQVIQTRHFSIGVDRPEDLKQVIQILKRKASDTQ